MDDVLASRIMEYLAGNGAASLSYASNRLGEDVHTIQRIANGLFMKGIIEPSDGGTYKIADRHMSTIAELVTEDGLALVHATQVVKEATDSPNELVTPADMVHDTIPKNQNTQGLDTQPPDAGPDPNPDSDDGSIETERSVHDIIQSDPTTLYQD